MINTIDTEDAPMTHQQLLIRLLQQRGIPAVPYGDAKVLIRHPERGLFVLG
jgi:hypothetical protein